MEQKKQEKEYSLLGEAWEEESEETDKNSRNIAALEQYNYFNIASIRKSVQVSKVLYEKGAKLIEEGKLQVEKVISGYSGYNDVITGQISAIGKTLRTEFPVVLTFSRSEVLGIECKCPECRKNYSYLWNLQKADCAYKAGLLKALEDYLETNNFGDATDINGRNLLRFYGKMQKNRIVAEAETKKERLNFVPRLTRKNGELSVAFKIGTGRLFIVKKLDTFCANVKNSATDTYGSSTQINHALDNFTESGKKWVRFISQVVLEEQKFLLRLLESRDYYGNGRKSVGGELSLFGWRLDEFYKLAGNEKIEFEDKDQEVKKKGMITCGQGTPRGRIQISEEQTGTKGEFHGIQADCYLPELYYGSDTAYYIENEQLRRIEKEFAEKLEPIVKLADAEMFSFHVGRNHISEFYHRILPQLEEVADIIETDPDKFRSYLLPDARFRFYLDAENQNVTCKAVVQYGNQEFSVLDSLKHAQDNQVFRDIVKENEVLFQVMQWLPEIDWEREELHCGQDEELVYEMMENGTEKLMELGEVHCTNRFRGTHTVKKVKVSVGVSVVSDLLELDISTEDVSQAELLELLNSYRSKKKYFRLKDGSFVNLEESELQMLAEMMDSMHIRPKEFVKGKMHLPIYRTLYLDKMLEENESVYSERDNHFKDIVKGFKTVKDADFEVPKSLSKIMRKYQKDGYKWLRTLENWKFGGILADDMGLGKTLQMIAVLLAAKQEARKGTSLVVAPASLVFNWGEEFRQFAPQLQVSLITGTQEERQKKLENYQEFDVLVTSYDLLKRDILLYEDKEFYYEIIDEAQYIKNYTTAAAKAVKVIKSKQRYALTGTPIENRLSELWSIFDYLMPGFLYGYDVFKKELEMPIVKNQDEEATARLQKMTAPFILRRLKENVLKDLPEKLEEHRYVQLNDKQQKLYDAQVLHMKENITKQNQEEFNKNKMLILAELTRLRQICCDPSLCFENYKGEAAKLEACLQLIQSAIDGNHRMLVFSQFTSMLEILQKSLDELKISYYVITGNTSKEKRMQLVKEFNTGNVPVFLISLKAGGVGLNLTGADVVIHYDPWWNLAVQNQATDRAHRIGQTKKVTVYKLIAKGTIEEKIQKLQDTKKNLADQIIGSKTVQLGSLGKDEMLELLGI